MRDRWETGFTVLYEVMEGGRTGAGMVHRSHPDNPGWTMCGVQAGQAAAGAEVASEVDSELSYV
jgi:hypothetical protein